MPETIQRSFTGGEIAPSLRARSTLSKYSFGLALCDNMFPRSQGGLYSRPGTRFVGEIDDMARRARLIPFSFNTDQTYILVFEHMKIRVIRDGGYVLAGGGPAIYELATPYTEEELPRLGYTQSADVMTIVHPDHEPANLSRTADDNWTLADIDYLPQISTPEWSATLTATITNITQANPAVVTAASHGLATDDNVLIQGVVGMVEVNNRVFSIVVIDASTFLLKDEDSTGYAAYTSGGTATRDGLLAVGAGAGTYDKTYSYVVTAVSTEGVESQPSTVNSLTTKSLSETAGIQLSWDSVAGAAYYRVYKDPSNNTNVFGWIGNSETTMFDDYNIAPLTSDAPPESNLPFTDLSGLITGFLPNDGIVTSDDHNLGSGDTVLIDNIDQPTDFNGMTFPVQVIDKDTFKILSNLVGPHPPYTSGGDWLRTGQKPASVNYYQQRQVFANSNERRQSVWATQTGNFTSFKTSTPSKADDALSFTIAAREVNEVRHIVEVNALILLTSGGEWRVTEGQDGVLTPATIGTRKQSGNGASWVTPVVVSDTVIYVQDKGTRIRDLNYEFVNDKFSGNDLSIMAEHLLEDKEVEEMTYSREPYGVIWSVRNDGVLLGLTYQREHQVWAWHQHHTKGQFESVATISEDNRDAVYCVVKRRINNSDVRYVERFEKRVTSAPEDVFCVDSGLTYDGAPATVISGLGHLEGEDVAVVADGNEVKNLTVSAGSITLPRASSKVTVGIPYLPVFETLEIDLSSDTEGLRAREKSISKVTLDVEKSRGGWIGTVKDNGDYPDMVEIKPRYDSDGYNPIALKTFKQDVTLSPDWNEGAAVRVEQRSPFPLAVLSITPEVNIG